jgi:hypothetical protein
LPVPGYTWMEYHQQGQEPDPFKGTGLHKALLD